MFQALKNKLVDNDNTPGIKKASNWKLPPKDFCYGKKEQPDKEGVSLVTRSWKIHNPSKEFETGQNFMQLNKLSIKRDFFDFKKNSDFRKSMDLKNVLSKGSIEKKIYLPNKDFTYGIKNRVSTPIKNIINYQYSNKAEELIRRSYSQMISHRQPIEKIIPKMTRYFEHNIAKKKEEKKLKESMEIKELYKMKKFLKVESKLKENLKKFKTYLPNIFEYKTGRDDNLDDLISKVEDDIKNLDD